MKKTLYSVLVGALTALMLVVVPSGASAAAQTEGFEEAVPAGWTAQNNSAPLGSTSVFQGFTGQFPAHQGPDDSYAGFSFSATLNVGTISVWLISPQYTDLSNGDAWSFFTRAPEPMWPDRLEVRMSTNGSCNPGEGATNTGDFTTLLTTINPDLVVGGYPTSWSEISGELSGIKGAKTGCLAFRYFVTSGGFGGTNSDYIGVDTYSFDDVPSDTTAPDTTIVSGPDGDTNDAKPTFEFKSSEADSTFECSLDEAEFTTCSGPGDTHTTATLDDGDHTIAVRAIDAAGNIDPTPATHAFTIDATAPETTIVSTPGGGITNDTTPTFWFASSEPDSTFECSLDEAEFTTCSGPDDTHTTEALDDGSYTFAVRATDALGNTDPTPARQALIIDTAAPDTTIVSGLDGTTQDTTPTFGFESPTLGSTFECSLDDAEFTTCSGPDDTHTTAPLDDGNHTFAVRAVDRAGNTDASPATRAFTIDTTAPDTAIVTGPDGDTQDTTPTFEFVASEAGSTFECSLDGTEFAACSEPVGTHTAALLSLGAHVIAVRATDSVGNTDASPATRAFTVVLPPVVPPVVTPAPKDCSVDQAAVTKAKTALTTSNKTVKSATKKVKTAKKSLKSAKKHGSKKAIKKSTKKLTKANKTVKKAKANVKKLKKGLAGATSKLGACQRG